MEAYLEQAWNHANIPAELANLRPRGDLVLVRVLKEPEMQGRIVLPQGHKENLAPRIGEVIAVGPGDRLHWWACPICLRSKATTNKAPGKCGGCDGRIWVHVITERHPMHVKPGDRILYWRTYANEVVVNEELYQLIHEEQHVVGILEN